MASLIAFKGTLYGTTYGGGAYGDGAVFSINASGSEKVLHSFSVSEGSSGDDGGNPQASLLALKGKLYGTTERGGPSGAGTVFGMTRAGTETMLYSFDGSLPAGREPLAGLIEVKGTLYGTTNSGGANDWSTVFSIQSNGTNESVLYSFRSGSDGASPTAGLTYLHGKFDGTTSGGDVNGSGTIFSVTKAGKEHVIHSFGIGIRLDGFEPLAGLLNVHGTLYGTTEAGGVNLPGCSHYDCDYGTIFALKP